MKIIKTMLVLTFALITNFVLAQQIKTVKMEYVTLNNGVQMPIAGFGTLNLQQDSCAEKVAMAIRKGYRLIDAARNYANEVEVGKGIRMSGIDRKELFITSKLWIKDAGYETTLKAFQKTLDRLGLDYLDLYLIHQPFGDIYGTWRAMEELYRQGKIRAIGVSNFEGDRLIDLIYHNEIKPAVNQIEINPYNQQMVDVAVCKEFGVQAEAWGPLGQMRRPELLEEPVLVNIGKKYGKTPAQIIFRWLTQRGIVVLCKTEHEAYMDENLSIFDFHLSEQDIVEIGKLETGRSIFRTHREPEDVKWFLEKATRPLLDEE